MVVRPGLVRGHQNICIQWSAIGLEFRAGEYAIEMRPAGAKARHSLFDIFGTTEVVPCYKAFVGCGNLPGLCSLIRQLPDGAGDAS